MRIVLGIGALSASIFLIALPAQAQTRVEQECRPYKQRGVFGLGGVQPSTSDGRVLKQCRLCTVTKVKFGRDTKRCEEWPTLPN